MSRKRLNTISFLLIAAGAFFLLWGAREYIGSLTGQVEAEHEFEQSLSTGSPPPEVSESPTTDSEPPLLETEPAPTPAPARPKPGETVAKLTIPRLDAKLYVVEGDRMADLRRGPGHLIGTAMPGVNGNCVIAGHRDTHFRVLKDIRKGDDIIIETSAGEYLYRVRSERVISTEDTEVLDPTPDAELSLITCYPFYYVGNAPERFLVEAQLVGAIRASS